MAGRRQPDIAIGQARLAQRLREKAKAASVPPIDELTIACVGARHPNPRRKGQPTGNRETEIMFAARGEAVVLRPEPDNKHDENAIAVYSPQGVQMGYVSAERTLLIRRAWGEARDVRAVFQERTPWGAWIRIGFDRDPVVPPESERSPTVQASADWWPDEEPAQESVDWLPPDD